MSNLPWTWRAEPDHTAKRAPTHIGYHPHLRRPYVMIYETSDGGGGTWYAGKEYRVFPTVDEAKRAVEAHMVGRAKP